eukprot:11203920-Lingulodinium_polyedra.AAC.1
MHSMFWTSTSATHIQNTVEIKGDLMRDKNRRLSQALARAPATPHALRALPNATRTPSIVAVRHT